MASKFFSNLFGVVDDEPETADYYEDQQPAQQAPAPVPTPAPTRSNKVVSINNARVAQQPNSSSKIELVEPRVYGDGKEIVNHLLNGNAVIVNFDQMDAKVAFRIVEYMKGATYAIRERSNGLTQKFSCAPPKTSKSRGN